ncbi:MAG: hypothetical protein ACK44M_14635, partial [Chloroflexus sp.]
LGPRVGGGMSFLRQPTHLARRHRGNPGGLRIPDDGRRGLRQPQPLFKKLDEKVIEEELARMQSRAL